MSMLRKFSRISVTSWVVRRIMVRLTWRPMCWSGDSLCRQRWNRLFTLATTKFHRVQEHELRGAQDVVRCHLDTDRGQLVQSNFWICLPCCMVSLLGWDLLCVMFKSSSGRKQKCMSTQIRSCVWERCIIIQKRMKNGKIRSVNFNNPTSTQNCVELMENQWSSSGIFPRIHVDWDSQTNPERSQRSRSLSRRVAGNNYIHNDIGWTKKKILLNGSRIPNKWLREGVSERTLVMRRSWKWGKWYRTYAHKPDGKWNQQANQMMDEFQQSGHPIFRGTRELDRGVLKRKSGRTTIHFTADSGNIELMLRTIHSTNQHSVHGAVSSWCIHWLGWSKQLDPQEVGSLLRNQPKTEGVAGNCWHDHLQRFEMMSGWRTSHRLWRSRIPKNSLRRNVLQNRWGREWWIWKIHRTVQRNTRHLGLIEILRSNFVYRIFFKKKIGPVLDVNIICHLEAHPGLEIQIRCTSGDNTNVWVVISKGPNRYVGELRYRNLEFFLEKLITNACRTRIKSKITFNWNRQMITLRFMNGNGKTSLPMNSVASTRGNLTSRTLSVSWYDMKIAERETDGAIHWEVILPKFVITFRRDGNREFTDRDWINYIWKGISETRFQYCQNSREKNIVHPSHSRLLKRRNDWTWDGGSHLHTAQVEPVCIPQRLFVRSQIHIGCRTHRGRARRSWEQTYIFFTPLNPWGTEEEEERRILLWWPHETQRSSLQNRVDTLPRRCLLDSSWDGTGEKHSVLANPIACNHRLQHYTTRLYLSNEWPHNAEKWLFTCDLLHHDLHHALQHLRSCWKLQQDRHDGEHEIVQGAADASTVSSKKKTRFRSISESSWSITRRHLQGWGADD